MLSLNIHLCDLSETFTTLRNKNTQELKLWKHHRCSLLSPQKKVTPLRSTLGFNEKQKLTVKSLTVTFSIWSPVTWSLFRNLSRHILCTSMTLLRLLFSLLSSAFCPSEFWESDSHTRIKSETEHTRECKCYIRSKQGRN